MLMILNGKECDKEKKLDVYSPATGDLIDRVPGADESDIDKAIEGAVSAFDKWSATPLWQRAGIIMGFLSIVKENEEHLAKTLCLDNGKPITQARAEIANLSISVPAFCEKAKHLYDSVVPPGTEKNYERSIQIVKREPLGVIACIIPFNFPSNLFSQKVIPALLMGNCVLVLPPSGNPLTVMTLCSYLIKAGLPEGVLSCLVAPGAVKETAVKDKRIRLVTLTGSTATGIRTAKVAADNLTRTALELGGNDPFIVMEDADMDLVISELFVGRLVNAGQICCASKRFLIHKSRVDEFLKKASDFISTLKMGDPMEEDTRIGCLINEKAAAKVEEQVRHTISQGASLYLGGKRNGAFFEPTILTNVTGQMDIAKDTEVFGPVIPVIPFDTKEEAIDIANSSVYGLSSCIFSENYHTLIEMSGKLQAGNVVLNGASNLRSFEIPFGGKKLSGVGSEGVMTTFDEMTSPKVITLKNCL